MSIRNERGSDEAVKVPRNKLGQRGAEDRREVNGCERIT